jgi:siroheme synthase
VPFEIVPGLTTASAAPTLAGIPLTHRGVASGFIVVSGHAPEAYEHLLHAVPIRTMTLIVLMGIRARARVAGFLLDRGWPSDTPAAIVSNASRRDQRVWRGTLRALSRHRTTAPRPAPGVIVIGDVAEIGTTIATAIRVRRPNGRLHEVTSTSPFQEVPWQR